MILAMSITEGLGWQNEETITKYELRAHFAQPLLHLNQLSSITNLIHYLLLASYNVLASQQGKLASQQGKDLTL